MKMSTEAQYMFVIAMCAELSPGQTRSLRKAFQSKGVVKDYNAIKMMCYTLINDGLLSFNEKKNGFIPTREGLIFAGLPVDPVKFSIDKCRHKLKVADGAETAAKAKRNKFASLNKFVKSHATPEQARWLSKIIRDVTQPDAVKVLSSRGVHGIHHADRT
jgi:hypothetical protein